MWWIWCKFGIGGLTGSLSLSKNWFSKCFSPSLPNLGTRHVDYVAQQLNANASVKDATPLGSGLRPTIIYAVQYLVDLGTFANIDSPKSLPVGVSNTALVLYVGVTKGSPSQWEWGWKNVGKGN